MRKMIYKGEEVIYIEYVDNLPHRVLTCSLESPCGLTNYDFTSLYNNKEDIRYYESGGGGRRKEIDAPQFTFSGNHKYWIAKGCQFRDPENIENCEKIEYPIRLTDGYRSSINPLKIAMETEFGFRYCEKYEYHVIDNDCYDCDCEYYEECNGGD
jgi:hypothetical protein